MSFFLIFRTWKVAASYNECFWGIEGNDLISCKVGADYKESLFTDPLKILNL